MLFIGLAIAMPTARDSGGVVECHNRSATMCTPHGTCEFLDGNWSCVCSSYRFTTARNAADGEPCVSARKRQTTVIIIAACVGWAGVGAMYLGYFWLGSSVLIAAVGGCIMCACCGVCKHKGNRKSDDEDKTTTTTNQVVVRCVWIVLLTLMATLWVLSLFVAIWKCTDWVGVPCA